MRLEDLISTKNGVGQSDGTQISLSQIANGLIQSVASSAARKADDLINNNTRSSNTQPVPDVTAAAAMPQVSSFTNAKAFGVSLPILAIGAAVLAFVLIKR